MLRDLLYVGAGSFAGGVARYLVSLAMKSVGGFPWATFTVNVMGCLLIGLLWGLSVRNSNALSGHLSLFLTVGFSGGFTTFSTFSKESLALLQTGSYLTFALYAVGSVLLGIAAVALGYLIAK
ncbi:MAG: fluoride efflux transporter CrcB [Bacteroidaceae bacterium]|nr:fluoride efflux transporter CrcB [Bacteroidaceae bacterium]